MKRFALLGHNIEFSLSPKIHKMVFEHLGEEADYQLFSVAPEDLEAALPALFELDGFNVTMPYKNRIAKYLDIDMGMGAVNTVMWYCGQKMGYNTDYYGFNMALAHQINPDGLSALVLGAGGMADSAVRNLVKMGAVVYIYSRTFEKSEALAQKRGVTAVTDTAGKFDIVINCTPFGLNVGENAGEGIDFSETKLAFDAIYFETEFLKTAAAAGAKVTDGLEMLVYQAIFADELFFETDIDGMDELAAAIMAELRNPTDAIAAKRSIPL